MKQEMKTIQIPENLHNFIRVYASLEKCTITEAIIRIIKKFFLMGLVLILLNSCVSIAPIMTPIVTHTECNRMDKDKLAVLEILVVYFYHKTHQEKVAMVTELLNFEKSQKKILTPTEVLEHMNSIYPDNRTLEQKYQFAMLRNVPVCTIKEGAAPSIPGSNNLIKALQFGITH